MWGIYYTVFLFKEKKTINIDYRLYSTIRGVSEASDTPLIIRISPIFFLNFSTAGKDGFLHLP
jgi:hypothetical protein